MMIKKGIKVALVFENLFNWGGAALVNQYFTELFPDADVYALFGTQKFAKDCFNCKKVQFSFLNKLPFIKNLYTYYLPLWPLAIESFDLSGYDLVLSASHAVAKGCITSESSMHISYVHTPMRYLWDLKDLYSKYGLLKSPFLNYLRIWDVSSSDRADKIVANSKFVDKRCKRYWERSADTVIYPPVVMCPKEMVDYKQRLNYFVIGAPFAENKGGEFAIESAKELGINLKVIGEGRGYKSLKKYASGVEGIDFLGRISEDEKWDVMSSAKGFLATGVEDFGIFPVEAISCGTPVLALKKGGYLETVIDGVNGVFYEENNFDEFRIGFEKLIKYDWNIDSMRKSVMKFNPDRFKREVEEFVRKSI